MQVVRAVRGEDGEAAGRAAGRGPLQDAPAEQEAEQVAGGLVGPVEVLDDQEERGQVGQVGEESRDALEELEAAAGVGRGARPRGRADEPVHRGVRGEGRGEPLVGGRSAEDLREREVRQTYVAEVHAVAGEDGQAGGGGVCRGLRQRPGLADTGVPGDQDGARVAGRGPLQDAGEPGEFVRPADERRIECLSHGAILARSGGVIPGYRLPASGFAVRRCRAGRSVPVRPASRGDRRVAVGAVRGQSRQAVGAVRPSPS